MAQDTWSADGFVKAGNEASSGAIFGESMDGGLTAVGNSQSTGLQLNSQINVITSSTATTGIATVLPVAPPLGSEVVVVNTTANALSAYPPSGGTINGGSANAADAGTVAAASSGVPGVKRYLATAALTYLRIA